MTDDKKAHDFHKTLGAIAGMTAGFVISGMALSMTNGSETRRGTVFRNNAMIGMGAAIIVGGIIGGYAVHCCHKDKDHSHSQQVQESRTPELAHSR